MRLFHRSSFSSWLAGTGVPAAIAIRRFGQRCARVRRLRQRPVILRASDEFRSADALKGGRETADAICTAPRSAHDKLFLCSFSPRNWPDLIRPDFFHPEVYSAITRRRPTSDLGIRNNRSRDNVKMSIRRMPCSSCGNSRRPRSVYFAV